MNGGFISGDCGEEFVNNFPEAVFLLDEQGVVRYINRAGLALLGVHADEALGVSLADFVHPQQRPDFNELIFRSKTLSETQKTDIIVNGRDGCSCLVRVSINAYDNGAGFHGLRGVMISTGEEALSVPVNSMSRKRAEYLQHYDELTSLLNRGGFNKRLREEAAMALHKKKRLAVMAIRIDFDRLQVVKDLDHALEIVLFNTLPLEIAERLGTLLFNEDNAARVSRQEYLTMHPIPRSDDVFNIVTLINKMLKIFSEPFISGIKLVTHIGVAVFPDDVPDDDPVRIIKNCQYACQEAVTSGKEYMFYNEHSHRKARERIDFIKDLIIAVKEDRCRDFSLYYQPKVDREGRVVGMEALARWSHDRWNNPDTGMVSPLRFIRTAEEIRLIEELGDWVLKEACRQTKEWQMRYGAAVDLQVSVNIAPSQLNPRLISYIDTVLFETGLQPQCLELEVTERETVNDEHASVIKKIRDKNISIAIDDFGIDYSVLSRLPGLPVNTIKLDKSYIDNITVDDDYDHLVRHTIQMVKGLNYKVVAEGVEDEEQAFKLFKEMHCDSIQGFFYYRPLSSRDFEQKVLN